VLRINSAERIASLKGTNFTNRVGYGNGDCYPTLFGWEMRKRPAYFTPDHELSSAVPPFRVPG
jgi:hypothetical protein